MNKKKFCRSGVVILALAITACTSMPTTITTSPTATTKNLGPTEGKACGNILLLGTAYNFIPVDLNSRVETAYNRALQSKPGAKSLVNVTVQENWYWWVIGTARCVTVKGEAIQ